MDTEIKNEVLDRIGMLKVDCPECEYMGNSDDQYHCGTCGCTGGFGKINALEYIKALYNGISPETVKEMLESLKLAYIKIFDDLIKEANSWGHDGDIAEELAQRHPNITNINSIITKAEREMKL